MFREAIALGYKFSAQIILSGSGSQALVLAFT